MAAPRLTPDLVGVTKGSAKAEPQAAAVPTPPGATVGKVALTLRITPDLHERLRVAAFEQRCSMQDIILAGIARQLDG